MNIKTFVLAAGLVTVASSQAVAQGRTDSPNNGSGSALTSLVVYAPPTFVRLVSNSGGSGVGVIVRGPGGDVEVAADVYLQLGATLRGAISPSRTASLAQAFGGTPQATALAQALAALGSSKTGDNLAAAVRAYNAAVNAGPDTPPAGLVVARAFLAGFTEP